MAEDRLQRKLTAILAADVVGYSRLMESDEANTRSRLNSLHSGLIEPRIASDGGRIVKTLTPAQRVLWTLLSIRYASAKRACLGVRVFPHGRNIIRISAGRYDVHSNDRDARLEGPLHIQKRT